MTLRKIISGGQTGADRGALDAALELGFPCGGWCPPGRLAADGAIALTYPLVELASGGYRKRTIKNIEDSDGTVIFRRDQPEGGSKLTLTQCQRLAKPHLVIDSNTINPVAAALSICDFLGHHSIIVMNGAGPSESRNPGIQAYVRDAMLRLLAQHLSRI